VRSIASAFLIACILLGSPLAAVPAAAQTTGTLVGTIKSARSVPVAGLEVYLVHPQIGRSRPAYTDAHGQFRLSSVPDINDLYFLEVYWDDDLVYWDRVRVQGYTPLAPIIVGT
jgi:hypothetical protein